MKNKVKYKQYLRSEEWKSLRNTILLKKTKCQCCEKKNAVDVHHMVYRNYVDTKISDLLPVCRDCHNYIHLAIKDNYISQDVERLDEIKEKTLNILNDENYKEYRKWLSSYHFLDKKDIKNIKKEKRYVIQLISGLLKQHVYYDDLEFIQVTGRQIEHIRGIVRTAKYRRIKKLDKKKPKY